MGELTMGEQPSEGLYEKLVENAGDVIAVLDEHGTIAFVNSRVQHYPGFTAIETIGRHYTELVHREDVDHFQELMELCFEGTPIVDYQFRVVMPDASISHWIANGAVVEMEGKRLLMAICRDVSESVSLRNELLNRNQALAALGKIAVALSSCSDLDDGLSQALSQILSALGVEVGAIVLKDATGRLRIGATSAPDLEALSAAAMSAGKLISQDSMERGEWIVVPDMLDEAVDPLTRELSRALGVEALVAVPLLSKDNVKASLALGVRVPAELSADQTEFLQLAAGILGPAIENAALHADLTDRVNRLAMLERLAKSINSGRDVQAVLGACMREIAHLVPYDMGVVVLFGDRATAEVFPFAGGGEPQAVRSMALNHEQLSRIAEVAGPISVPGSHEMGKYHTQPGTFDMQGGSAGLVPLVRMEERFGLLKVWSHETGRYGAHEMEILAAAAEHLSIAASNAAMYEHEQQRSLELVALASEVRHRIKNNLQMISGLLEMSRPDPESGAKTVLRCLRQVRAISTIHDLLSPDDISAKMQLRECLLRVAENAVQATGRADEVKVSVSGEDCTITSDAATAFAIMVNELVSNAVEHGFKGLSGGLIEIRVCCSGSSCTVEVNDNGIGLPEDFIAPQPSASANGLGLVSSLAAYGLGGKLEIERGERGVSARVSVKGARSGIESTGS